MSELTIITNNVPRDTIDAWELSPKERTGFDYIDWQGIDEGRESATFVRYQGRLYDLSQFMPSVPSILPYANNSGGWDAYCADSYFSGVLMRFANCDQVIMGRYYS